MASQLAKDMSYNAIKEDIELQLKLIDKYVKVNILGGLAFIGYVHSYDPTTDSIILLIPHKNEYKTAIILGHTISGITEEVEQADIKPPKRNQSAVVSKEELSKRRKILMAWFERQLLPVSELDDKIIIGDVTLLPPYNSLDVCTENPIVALHIKKILDSLPEDFSPN